MNPPRPVPKHIQEGLGFQTFWINTQSYQFIPKLAAALKEASARRRQFLPYFTAGNFLGESVLSRPVCAFVRSKQDGEIGGSLFKGGRFEYPELFVRGHQLTNKLLIIMLNNATEPRTMTVPSKFALWLPPAAQYRITYYDDQEENVREQTVALAAGAEWAGKTDLLQPLAMAFFEIEALGTKANKAP